MLAYDLQRVREKAVSADIVGYDVEDLQGTIGEVERTTEELVPSFISVDTVSSLPAKRVTLPAAVIERIDHDARKIYVDRRHKEIENAPQSLNDETDRADGYLGELRRYYGPGGAGYRAPRDAWTEAFSRAFVGDRIDADALLQREKPIRERMRLPETGVRDLLLAAGIHVVAFLVVVMAALVATNALRGKRKKYRPQLLPYFGAAAGLNKGLGSGGYGPVVTLGGVMSGLLEKTSVAITTMSEGFASTAGAITFLVIAALGTDVDWRLLPWLWLGAFPASVVGPYAVRVLPVRVWRYFVPVYATAIATVLLVEIYGV